MAVPRFFVPQGIVPEAVGIPIELPEAAAHHATRVLRLAPGDVLTLFTGTGGEYAATLVAADRRGATARIDRFDPVERESRFAVTLAQSVAANDAMDYAIRKAVELGVTAIQPLVTERSAPVPAGERGDKRLAHWRQIVVAACEQCGRNRVPGVAPARSIGEWLAAWSGAGVVLAPDGVTSLCSLAAPAEPLALLVGPEGGWTTRELAAASACGFKRLRLGPRILRTETAGIAALAVMQATWGDLR
jgi:16S rRNA (uracil1498-N3)-methyltransferase